VWDSHLLFQPASIDIRYVFANPARTTLGQKVNPVALRKSRTAASSPCEAFGEARRLRLQEFLRVREVEPRGAGRPTA